MVTGSAQAVARPSRRSPRRLQPAPTSNALQAETRARAVAQTGSLLCRGLAIRRQPPRSRTLPTASRRTQQVANLRYRPAHGGNPRAKARDFSPEPQPLRPSRLCGANFEAGTAEAGKPQRFMGSRHGPKPAHWGHEPKTGNPKIWDGQRFPSPSLSTPDLWVLIGRLAGREGGRDHSRSVQEILGTPVPAPSAFSAVAFAARHPGGFPVAKPRP